MQETGIPFFSKRRSAESTKKWEPCYEETQHNFAYDIRYLARTEKLAAADPITTVPHPQKLQSLVLQTVILVHAVRAQMGSGSIGSLILNLRTR